jgi:predicted dehydrogenase
MLFARESKAATIGIRSRQTKGEVTAMVHATADGSAGSRLRVGMVGGGRSAFIGAVHRFAIRLDDQIVLVAGALSADPANAAASAADLGIAPDRAYADWREMARAEAARPDGIEAVVIVTPNHLHGPVATAFLEAGIDVICDKPLAMDVPEAEALVTLTRARGRRLLVTLNNTGYAMVRQAREMVAAGELGRLFAVHASYLQDWLTKPIDAEGHKQAAWRTDPARAGQSAVLADIGVHAYSLACFTSGLVADAVSAELFTAVPGRRLDDNAHLLVRWSDGVRGTLVASQTSPGHYNDLSVRLYGDRAGLEWHAGRSEELRFTPYGEPTRTIFRGGAGGTAASHAVSRMPVAHPEGYIEAFANLYRDAATVLRAHRSGAAPDPAIAAQVPDVEDGALGVRFVAAAVESSAAGGAWTSARR